MVGSRSEQKGGLSNATGSLDLCFCIFFGKKERTGFGLFVQCWAGTSTLLSFWVTDGIGVLQHLVVGVDRRPEVFPSRYGIKVFWIATDEGVVGSWKDEGLVFFFLNHGLFRFLSLEAFVLPCFFAIIVEVADICAIFRICVEERWSKLRLLSKEALSPPNFYFFRQA